MLIRDAAISTDQLGKYIYVVNDSDKVVYTPVTAGSLVDDSMRVRKVRGLCSMTAKCVLSAGLPGQS